MPNFKYIPGATNSKTGKGIPWMTSRFGTGTLKAGINARMLGFRNVERNLTIQMAKLKMNTHDGLEAFAEYVYKDMLVTPPIIPRLTGELRDSWATKRIPYAGGAIEAGFYADYALYVHEMTDDAYMRKINWTEPMSGAKFFQYGLQRNAKLLKNIVALKTKIGTI
jgi:hypothetical protein